jgi:hypothetical protein
MFIKILSKANRNGFNYYACLASDPNERVIAVSSTHRLTEGYTYRGMPKVHWIDDDIEGSILAHYIIEGNQTPMEKTF